MFAKTIASFFRTDFLLISFLFISTQWSVATESAQNDIPQELLMKFGAWCSITCQQPHNDIGQHISIKEYQAIVDLGLPAVPYMVDMMKSGSSFDRACLCSAVRKITKVSFHKQIRTEDKQYLPRYKSYWIWWKTARVINLDIFDRLYKKWSELVPEEKFCKPFTAGWQAKFQGNSETYEQAYQEWKSLPDGKEKENNKPFQRSIYQQILDLGIDVLPLAIEKAGQGDKDIINAIDYWTDGKLKKDMSNTAMPDNQQGAFCLAWWKENKEFFQIPGESSDRERITSNGSPKQVTYNSHSFAILDSTSEWLCWDMDYDDNDIIDPIEYDYFMEQQGFTSCPLDDPDRIVTSMKALEPSSPTGNRVTHSGRKSKDPSAPDQLMESKLGMQFRILHPLNQLESEIYGKIWRHYKRK
jgi:hypothetical protein